MLLVDALGGQTTTVVMNFVRDQQGTTDRDHKTRCSEVRKSGHVELLTSSHDTSL